MKIKSTFSDYYDSVMSYGHDDTTTFVRKGDTFLIGDDTPNIIKELYVMLQFVGIEYVYRNQIRRSNDWFIDNPNYYHANTFSVRKIDNNILTNHHYSFEDFQIVFCGEGFRGIKVIHSNDREIGNKYYYFYDIEEFKSFIEENGVDLKVNDTNHRLEPFFGSISLNKEFLIENKISIATKINKVITINDSLSRFAFYKVIDAFSAFQKLDTWTSGVLAYPPNFMIEIADKYKISQHGFDTKYGFRTRPTKKVKQ